MLTIPKWKAFIILLICVLSVYLSIPTLFPTFVDSKAKHLFPDSKVNLGLDLRGGASLLLEIDTDSYLVEQMHQYSDQIKSSFKEDKVLFKNITTNKNQIRIELESQDATNKAKDALYHVFGNTADSNIQGTTITVGLQEAISKGIKHNLMAQTMEIVRRRVDETGTKEVDLQIQGENQILLQVPGLNDPNQLKRILGKTAKLSFHLVDLNANVSEALQGRVPFGSKLLPLDEKEAGRYDSRFVVVKNRAVMTGDMLIDAKASVHNTSPVVEFKLNNVGGKIFADVTNKNTGKLLAIVLDERVISAPAIREPILGGSGTISGNFTIQSANELALLLRAGALPAPINIIEERTVGPSLGADSIEAGKRAVLAGIILVMLFMFLFYGMFGMVANIALIVNLFMILAALSLFNATLTLPGIAGMVLTLGMAVDANVLIFERIKEELAKGRPVFSSLQAGYKFAFGTILDSNITTIVAALILYILGAGPVKGFAVTLSIGIICSMFTAVSLTQLIIMKWYRIKQPKTLSL